MSLSSVIAFGNFITSTLNLLSVSGAITPEQREAYESRYALLAGASIPVIGDFIILAAELRRLLDSDDFARRMGEIAREQNPAFRKPTPPGGVSGLAALAIGLTALLGLGACAASKHAVTALPETDTMRAGYSVVWPGDVSRVPSHFVTVEVLDPETGERHMVTTAPKAFED